MGPRPTDGRSWALHKKLLAFQADAARAASASIFIWSVWRGQFRPFFLTSATGCAYTFYATRCIIAIRKEGTDTNREKNQRETDARKGHGGASPQDLQTKQRIFGSFFLYANKLQVIGDRMDPNVTMKQWFLVVCIQLFEQPPTLSAVADFMGCSRQNVKKLATRLQQRGFVQMQRSGRDARACTLTLTQRCIDYFRAREDLENAYLERVYEGLDAAQLQALDEGLQRVGENIFAMQERSKEGRLP